MAEKISMTPNELSEAQRGWFRTMVTSAVGVISLVTSTWLVISSITEVKHTVKSNTTTVQTINTRVKVLEDLRIPRAVTTAKTESALSSIDGTLKSIELRLFRIENKDRAGFNVTPSPIREN